MKKSLVFTTVTLSLILFACAPKEHLVDCFSNTGTYVCFNGEGRDATYARWNFDSVETFNAFNIQGSYPPVPGTVGPWTTVNISLVTSTGNFAMETGDYIYKDWLADENIREYTFDVRHYTGDAKDPVTTTFRKKNPGGTTLKITNVDGTGKLSGVFYADIRNINDFNDSATVKFFFTDIPLQ